MPRRFEKFLQALRQSVFFSLMVRKNDKAIDVKF